jgi:hypothetical protein
MTRSRAKSRKDPSVSRRTTPEDVRSCYRILLGREPDTPRALVDRALAFPDHLSLTMSFLQSGEFAARLGAARVVDRLDAGAVLSFARPSVVGRPGYVTDFMGGRIAIDLLAWAHNKSGQLEPPPTAGSVCGEFGEWAAVLELTRRAAARDGGVFRAVEVGAAFGPWLVSVALAARSLGRAALHLVGVEPAPEFRSRFHQHLSDNGLVEHAEWIEAAVMAQEGRAVIPALTQPSWEFGQRAAAWTQEGPAPPGLNEARAMTLPQVLAKAGGDVDVLLLTHGDEVSATQGVDWSKADVSTVMATLTQPHAGTALWQTFADAGWRNIVDLPSRIRQSDADPTVIEVIQDGCQGWVNPRRLSMVG